MFDEKNQEQVVEETLEASEIQNVEKASADDASTTTADNVAEIADYLNPELFNDIKTLSDSDLDESSNPTIVSDEIEKKYSNTFGDISEHSLIEGRVVGSQQWIKSFGGFYGKNGNVLQKSPIGGYILISSRYSFNNNAYNMWLIKMDLNGDTEWTKTFGGLKNDYGFSIATTLDGGYVITGGTESYGFENADFSDLWFLKTDINGNTLYP